MVRRIRSRGASFARFRKYACSCECVIATSSTSSTVSPIARQPPVTSLSCASIDNTSHFIQSAAEGPKTTFARHGPGSTDADTGLSVTSFGIVTQKRRVTDVSLSSLRHFKFYTIHTPSKKTNIKILHFFSFLSGSESRWHFCGIEQSKAVRTLSATRC